MPDTTAPLAGELVGAVNDVTVTQGSQAAFTIDVSAPGPIRCVATAANPATATVRTAFAISANGVLTSSAPSAPLAFFAGAPQGGPNCATTWTGFPAAYQVAASVTTAATTPVGTYTIVLSAPAGTTSVSTPGSGGAPLTDLTATNITVGVVAPAETPRRPWPPWKCRPARPAPMAGIRVMSRCTRAAAIRSAGR